MPVLMEYTPDRLVSACPSSVASPYQLVKLVKSDASESISSGVAPMCVYGHVASWSFG